MCSQRLAEAVEYACHLHRDQKRKLSGVPYLAHLLGVAAMVLADGGGEDELIAALLHDAAEDQGGETTLAEIGRHFGKPVAEMVEACSDTLVQPKPPWRQRKERHLAHLAGAPLAVRRIKAADKLDNCRSIIAGYRAQGEEIWQHFRGGRDGTLWYYRAGVETLRLAGTSPLVEELARTVEELERLTGRPCNP